MKLLKHLLLPEISELVRARDWRALKDVLVTWPAQDVADLLESLNVEDAGVLLLLLPPPVQADVFAELVPERQEALLRSLGDQRLREIVLGLPPDDRTELFEEMPASLTRRLLDLLPVEEKQEALRLLGYPENSVGRLMTPDFVSVRPDWSVGRALDHIRANGRDAETIDMVYVVDEHGHLIDDVPLRRFILAERNQLVSDLMDKSFVAVPAHADQEEAAEKMKRYDLVALPVTSTTGVLLGIVTFDDIFQVLEEETTEDFHKTAAVRPLARGYLGTSVWELFRKRIVWLLVLLVSDFFSSGIIAHFEKALQAVIALAFYIPVLIDSGGNTASQSATIVIRALATGDLTIKRWFAVVKKELLTGLLIGLTLGAVCFLGGSLGKGGSRIGMVVGLSMMALALWTNILGGLLPVVITKLRLDPAAASSPLLTTVADVTGLLIYFGIAAAILG
ncbi:MAG: magnesium transporter [candidate division WOR-3 bacterium]